MRECDGLLSEVWINTVQEHSEELICNIFRRFGLIKENMGPSRIHLSIQKQPQKTGVSSLGVPWQPQILADQLTLSQPGGAG